MHWHCIIGRLLRNVCCIFIDVNCLLYIVKSCRGFWYYLLRVACVKCKTVSNWYLIDYENHQQFGYVTCCSLMLQLKSTPQFIRKYTEWFFLNFPREVSWDGVSEYSTLQIDPRLV